MSLTYYTHQDELKLKTLGPKTQDRDNVSGNIRTRWACIMLIHIENRPLQMTTKQSSFWKVIHIVINFSITAD